MEKDAPVKAEPGEKCSWTVDLLKKEFSNILATEWAEALTETVFGEATRILFLLNAESLDGGMLCILLSNKIKNLKRLSR